MKNFKFKLVILAVLSALSASAYAISVMGSGGAGSDDATKATKRFDVQAMSQQMGDKDLTPPPPPPEPKITYSTSWETGARSYFAESTSGGTTCSKFSCTSSTSYWCASKQSRTEYRYTYLNGKKVSGSKTKMRTQNKSTRVPSSMWRTTDSACQRYYKSDLDKKMNSTSWQ